MGEPHPSGSGWAAVWVAAGPAPADRPPNLDERARRHRATRAAARRFGRELVEAYTSCPPEKQVWDRDERGRPLVAEPGGPQVSLSHATAVVAAALSFDAPVGVDVERLRPLPEREALARTALSAGERQVLAGLPDELGDAQLLRYWTRKEAVAKALGTGLATHLREVVTTAEGTLVGLPAGCGEPAAWTLADVAVQDGVVACVAVRAPGIRVLARMLELPAPQHGAAWQDGDARHGAAWQDGDAQHGAAWQDGDARHGV